MKLNIKLPIAMLARSVLSAQADVNMGAYQKALSAGEMTEVVADYVSKNKEDVVALVKEAIIQTEASVDEVAEIVKVAIKAAPKQARAIYVAALAVAPDAHDEVMKVYYALTPNSGPVGSDAKGGLDNKGNKGATTPGSDSDNITPPNPLVFPTGFAGAGANQVGPPAGSGIGGFGLIPVGQSPATIQPTIPPAAVSQF